MHRMIKIHYQKKHRIFNDDSTVNHEKKKKKKNKQRKKKTTNSSDEQQIMGGTFTDGTKWGDAIYQQTGRCSACFVQTQHTCIVATCMVSICNKCYGWPGETERKCWAHKTEEEKSKLIQDLGEPDSQDIQQIIAGEEDSEEISDINVEEMLQQMKEYDEMMI